MKKTIISVASAFAKTISVAVLIAVALVSCIDDTLGGKEDALIIREFTATFADDYTKTSNGALNSIDWIKGDIIRYYSADTGSVRSQSVVSDGHSTTISAQVGNGDKYFVATYGGTAVKDNTGNGFTMSGAVTEIQDGSFGNAHISVAKVNLGDNTSHITLQNMTSMLKFALERQDIRKIVFTAVAGEKIHGDGTLKFAFKGTSPSVEFGDAGGSSITLNVCGAGTYYMSTLPVTLAGGFTMDMYSDGDKLQGSVSSKEELVIGSKKIIDLGKLDSKIVDFFSISQNKFELSCEAGEIEVVVTTNAGFEYHIENSDWITDISDNPSSGNLKFAITENTKTEQRTGIISICSLSGQCYSVTVVQAGKEKGPDPVLSISSEEFKSDCESSSKNITVTSNVNWEVKSSANWCTVSPASGSGNGSFTITLAENETTDSRTATVTVMAGDLTATVSITQEGKEEKYFSISQNKFELSCEAGEIEVVVTTNAGFEYHIENSDWITDISDNPSSGNLKFAIAENTKTEKRTGLISICSLSGQCYSVTVVQAGKEKGPEPILSISSEEFKSGCESSSKAITVTSNVNWEVKSSANWCTVSPASGSGNGSFTITLAKNETTDSRTATVMVSASGLMATVSVTQEGKDDESEAPWLTKTFYHKSLAMRFTATWCGYCPIMNETIELAMNKRPSKFEYVAMHGSGDLEFSGASALVSQYFIGGYPTGIVDGRAQIPNYSSEYGSTLFTAVLDETEKNYPTMTSTSFSSKIEGNTVIVDVQLYAKVADDYKITVLLLEDNIVGYQADYTNGAHYDYVHNSVARLAFTSSTGDAVKITNPAKAWKKSYSATIPSGCNKENLRILVYVQKPFGNQTQAKGVSDVTYGNYGGYYVDNANAQRAGVKAELIYVDDNENVGITDPIGALWR